MMMYTVEVMEGGWVALYTTRCLVQAQDAATQLKAYYADTRIIAL